ncbi:MAG: glycosyltransferase family 39 protein, partial [Acidobacteria bacterium]|nr:glycosyltransferase family 39 protein [Acidobacteriota bacterium]
MAGLDRRRALGALLLILALAAALRLSGIGWGGANSLHPDERFLSMVAASLESNDRLVDYFDTSSSTLNPENVGSKPAFVYGTYPLILVRLLGEAAGWTGMNELRTMGRMVSTGWDLLTIIMIYLLGARLADRRTGILAAFFLGVTVLHIQQSHYFTVDLAQTFFVTFALYLAVGIGETHESDEEGEKDGVRKRLATARFGASVVFGAVAAAAVAAKLSAAPVVLLLPAAHLLRLLIIDRERRCREILPVVITLIASGLVFGLAFRVLQPYAFAGPGFFDIGLNPRWTRAIDNLRRLTGAGADWPPAMQWARRSFFYSGHNLVRWGFGLPLGLLAIAGTVAAVRRIARRGAGPSILVVVWVIGFFTWQSLQGNPTMRYQLPIYPAAAFLAAWLVTAAGRRGPDAGATGLWRRAAPVVGIVIGAATLIYAVAFTGIYLRPITREAASRWMLEAIPGPINLHLDTGDGDARQPIAFGYDRRLTGGEMVETRARAVIAGRAHTLVLPRVLLGTDDPENPITTAPEIEAVVMLDGGDEATATGACSVTEPGVFGCTLELDRPLTIAAADSLTIKFVLNAEPARWAVLTGGAIANETSWDDGLPLRFDGYDPYGGIYQRDLNFELYWNDDPAKRERMLEILDRSDYISISSNRQWASLPRIPERYPLVTTYYRHLVGCPVEQSVVSCFIAAEPGDVGGDLGFELAATFTSPPSLGPLVVNDQRADEAFTVYDHPKVLIFRKSPDYDPVRV